MRSAMHWNDWRTISCSSEAARVPAPPALQSTRLGLVAAHRAGQLRLGACPLRALYVSHAASVRCWLATAIDPEAVTASGARGFRKADVQRRGSDARGFARV